MKYEHKVLIIVGLCLLLFGVAVLTIQESTDTQRELLTEINRSGCDVYLKNYLTRIYGPDDFRVNTSYTEINSP